MSKTVKPKVDAKALLDLLAVKHSEDVFVPECKTGASGYRNEMFRMDAWAMRKSWSKMSCIAYEIKVARGDFMQDQKWQAYLPYCNEFYFVAPPNVIRLEEVPEDAGLMVCTTNATRLLTKKKAPFRGVQICDNVFRYILLWRARITRESLGGNDASWWQRFVEGRANDKEIGHRASRRIRDFLSKRVEEVESENRLLKRNNEKYAEIAELLRRLGINEQYVPSAMTVERRLEEAQRIVPARLENTIEWTIDRLKDMQSAIEELRRHEPESA